MTEAVETFDRLLLLTPDTARGLGRIAAPFCEQGRFADALASSDRAIALKPGHALAWLNRGIALQMLGRFDQALESFDQALALMPRHVAAWRGRASALVGLERIADAVASFDKALEIMPGDPEILAQRTAAQETAKRITGIPAGLEEVDSWYKRATMFHVTQRLADLLDALDHALAIQPDYPPALLLKGAVLCEARRVREGLEAYRRHAVMVNERPAGRGCGMIRRTNNAMMPSNAPIWPHRVSVIDDFHLESGRADGRPGGQSRECARTSRGGGAKAGRRSW